MRRWWSATTRESPPRDLRRPRIFAWPRYWAAGNTRFSASEVCGEPVATSGVNLWARDADVDRCSRAYSGPIHGRSIGAVHPGFMRLINEQRLCVAMHIDC